MIKVKLREKPIKGDRMSLYLDFYPAIPHPETGELTRREFLGMYIYEKPKNPVEKEHNKGTRLIAEQIRQKRDNALNKPEIYTAMEREQIKALERGEKSFLEYYTKLARKRSGSNHDNWKSSYAYLERFTNGKLKFSEVTESFCNDYREYLLKAKSHRNSEPLSQNSALGYFNKFKAALKQAYKEGMFSFNVNERIDGIKPAETRRQFLTLDELNSLVKTECESPLLKRAALFSALTGLRHSDIMNLKWSQVEHIKGQGYYLHFSQQKTKGVESHPMSDQAYSLLGEPRQPHQQVFDGLVYSAYLNKKLKSWVLNAGIKKDITFHCFRHTYATLQLSLGTDIYTVSKMLGHRELKTTQVYAKIIDQTKRKAADIIKLEL